jgi:hypothetical protein
MKFTREECNRIFNELPLTAQQWLMHIVFELNSAIEAHPSWPSDMIHKAAIVQEEAGELIKAAVQFQYEDGSISEIVKEARQTGAMALRFLLNLSNAETKQE